MSTWDDREFRASLREYCDVKKMKLPEGLEKRVVSIVFKIIKASKEDAQPTKQIIQAKVASLGRRVKIRSSIRQAGGSFERQAQKEVNLRAAAIGYTRYGWLKCGSQLGTKGRALAKKFGNSVKGGVRKKLTGHVIWIEFYNGQPAAELMNQKHSLIQRAVDADSADMRLWMENRLKRAKQRAKM